MFRAGIILVWHLCNCFCLKAQSDSFEVNSRRYHGYSMPIDTFHHSVLAEFRPTGNEIKLAEKLVRENLLSYCLHLNHLQIRESWIIATRLRKYYRQYDGHYEKDECRKIIGIIFISPEWHYTKDELKLKHNIPFDGGPDFFFAWVDLDTRKISFTDAGWVN